jgi:hypothetical protein
MLSRDKDVAYETKKFTKRGFISVYDLDMNYVTGKKYYSPKDRNDTIEFWKKIYPNKKFYIVIKPTL